MKPKPIKLLEVYLFLLLLLPLLRLGLLYTTPGFYRQLTDAGSLSIFEQTRAFIRFGSCLLALMLWVRVRKSSSLQGIRIVLLLHVLFAGVLGYLALSAPPPASGLLATVEREPIFAYGLFVEAFASLFIMTILNASRQVKTYYGAGPSHNSM